MLEPRQHPNFPDEPQLSRLGARVGIENLQSHAALVSRVAGKIDDCKSALPNLALNFVPAFEGCTQGRDWIVSALGVGRNRVLDWVGAISHDYRSRIGG